MTLDEMLKLAKYAAKCCEEGSDGERLGRAVLDMLGESQPCGFEVPTVETRTIASAEWPHDLVNSGPIVIGHGAAYTAGEARAYAAMLLRAADEAEAKP